MDKGRPSQRRTRTTQRIFGMNERPFECGAMRSGGQGKSPARKNSAELMGRLVARCSYFFIGSAGIPSFFIAPSFFIMSAHMASFFIIASSFFVLSFIDIAM